MEGYGTADICVDYGLSRKQEYIHVMVQFVPPTMKIIVPWRDTEVEAMSENKGVIGDTSKHYNG